MAKKKTSNAYTAYGEASAAEVHEILDAAYKGSLPVVLVGSGGVGKSALLRSYAVEHGLGHPITLLLSTMDPTDMSGLPTRGETEHNGHTVAVTEFGMPWWQECLLNGEYPDGSPCKSLFIDELSCCSPALQSAALALVNERILPCGEQLSSEVQLVLAMNPESVASDYSPISPVLANRLCMISYKPTDEEVYEGLTGGWFSEEEQAAWSDNERAWRNRIVDFLRHTNGAYILMENDLADGALESEAPAYLQPDAENSDSEREILTTAWASPRAWDNVARVLSYTGFEKKVTPIQERILAGTVGRKATVPLMEYVEEHAKLDPFTVIKNPEMQEWHANANAAGAAYNDILALARAINESIPKCDGLDGRPTPQEALDFYDKVIDLGGGAHFMTAYCQDNNGPGHYFKKNIPEGVERRDWMAKINGILVKFRDADLIPDAKAK